MGSSADALLLLLPLCLIGPSAGAALQRHCCLGYAQPQVLPRCCSYLTG